MALLIRLYTVRRNLFFEDMSTLQVCMSRRVDQGDDEGELGMESVLFFFSVFITISAG